MDFHDGWYDTIRDLVDTKRFTNLDGVEIIDECHPFIYFLNWLTAFVGNTISKNILHGWYDKESGTAKFLVIYPSDVGNVVTHAWRAFIEHEDADVYIYSRYCGQIYESNEFEEEIFQRHD